jgi:two-component system, cell cycle sensor histidine kinase and response regulator CckA
MRGNSPVILIADDEEQIGMLASICLTKLGYVTFLANGGSAAIEHWQRHGGEIDMLLTDLAMPDVRGDHLAEKLLKEKPNLLVFFMSGSPLKPDEIGFRLREGENFLHKPFSRDTLTALFKRYLPSVRPNEEALR